MTKVPERLISVFRTWGRKAAQKWPSLKAMKAWLAAEPRDEDFKKWYLWWIPPRRRAFVITLTLALAMLLAKWLYARLVLDADFDNPDKFEQVYNLDGFFPFAEDAVKIESNLFGLNADRRLRTRAELRRWHGDAEADSIQKLNKYLKFASLTIWSSEPTLNIAVLPGEPNLHSALQALVKLGLVRFQRASLTRGVVYSFDLEMEVYRGDHSIGAYMETFHFRADSKLEILAFAAAVALAFCAFAFVLDLTDVAWDYRWRKYFKVMAGILAEVLYNLKFPIKQTLEVFDFLPPLARVVNELSERIINQLVEKLEQFIAVADDAEVKTLRDESLTFLKQVKAHAALPLKTENELMVWKQSLEDIVGRTEQLRARLTQLSKRRYRRFKAPLSREALTRAIKLANKTLLDTSANIVEVINQVNGQRRHKRRQHEERKSDRRNEIAHTLNDYLDRPHIKHDMEKLGQYFQPEIEATTIFATPGFQAEGKIKSSGKIKDDRRCYDEIFFPAPLSKSAEEKIWLVIAKKPEEYYEVAPVDKSREPDLPSAVTILFAVNPPGNQVPIYYTVEMTSKIGRLIRDQRVFQIAPLDIALRQPRPDPEPWFAEIPPIEPRQVMPD